MRRGIAAAGLLLGVAGFAEGAVERDLGGGKVYVTAEFGAGFIEVDVNTGNRRFIDLEQYPLILKSTDAAVGRDGFVYVETVDALQRRGIYRVQPGSGAREGFTGFVDGFATDPIGTGPAFGELNGVLLAPAGMFLQRSFQGPMAVDRTTRNRRIVAQSDDRPTTETAGQPPSPIPMYDPTDVIQLDEQHLLIADRFDGLLRVHIASGERTRLFPDGAAFPNPRRMDRLPDGRLVYTLVDPDAAALWAVDLRTGLQELYSGSFGGWTAGEGPEFRVARDLTVDEQGRLWIYDSILGTLFLIGRDGTRTEVSSPTVGEGDGFFPSDFRPGLATFERDLPPPQPIHGWAFH